MKVGYLGSPGPYGHFTLFRNVRAGLTAQGQPIRWIANGRWAAETMRDPAWESEAANGEVVGGDSTDMDTLGKALVRHIIDQKYEAILFNFPQNISEMNVARYLPESILRVLVVGMMGSGTYRLCRGVRDYVHATVALAPRIRDDLVGHFDFDAARTSVCGGIDLEPFRNLPERQAAKSLRLVYFGRITEGQKGIFNLPLILQRVLDEEVVLHVIGGGPDLGALKERCAKFGPRVTFGEPVRQEDIPRMLVGHDVFVFPTRYEGLGYVLPEALAAGCVPVCSHIRGVTDYLVRDGETGFLFPVDDVETAAAHVRRLARDRQLLKRCSDAAVADARERFDCIAAGAAWAKLLRDLKKDPPTVAATLPLERWAYPRQFNRGLRGYVPERLKNVVRAWMAR
ncbi:MAG: glycosyltransferase family 4 protein [Tepidisphaeraceae bacterium]|jgi:glycosyltransferase involved in cell wall biosynthesis